MYNDYNLKKALQMNSKLSIIAFVAISATTLNAMQFQTIGYKSISMGGAGVASSASSTATYNNPALLAKASHKSEISFGAGISAYDHGIGSSIQALDDNDFMDLIDKAEVNDDSLSEKEIKNLYNSRNIALDMDNKGLEVSPHFYLGAQVNNWGFGVFGTFNVAGTAQVSQTKDKLIYETDGNQYRELLEDGSIVESTLEEYENSSIVYAMDNEDTAINTVGVGIIEVPIAYAHKFELSKGDVYVGATLKYMKAMTYIETLQLDNEENDDSDNDFEETSSSFGIDFGVAYEPNFVKNLTVAMVVKNLNAPKFSLATGGDVTIDPMLRIGAAYNIQDNVEVAMDIDLTKNETFIPGLDSQMIGAGVDYHPASWASLRAGLMTNLDSADEAGMIYTLGLGLGAEWLQIDLSAQMSSSSGTIDGTSYPQYTKVNLALISRF
jgi:hypothetical protein